MPWIRRQTNIITHLILNLCDCNSLSIILPTLHINHRFSLSIDARARALRSDIPTITLTTTTTIVDAVEVGRRQDVAVLETGNFNP
jgi:hypothetical protein